LGSFKHLKKREQPPGKIDSPLNEKLNGVKWGEFRLGDLFDIENTWIYGKNKQYETRLNEPSKKSISVVSGITINNGINYWTCDKLDENEIFKDCLTISTRGEYSGTVTYHKENFVLANNILTMPMPNWSEKAKLFIASVISKIGYGGYSGYPRKETLKNDIIQLPITPTNEIDFDFMESFISELEEERISELNAYLLATGLKDYTLTEEEEKVLKAFENVEWGEYGLPEIFNINNTHNILSSEIVENSGKNPYLCASAENNGVSSYISYKDELLENGNCIFIGGKTFVVSYQKDDFYSNDSHNLALYLKEQEVTKANQLYLATCIYKSLNHKYSWGNSISGSKIKNDKFQLPTKNNAPDYATMETFIKAIEKLVIKDVVLYGEKKIEATKKVVENER